MIREANDADIQTELTLQIARLVELTQQLAVGKQSLSPEDYLRITAKMFSDAFKKIVLPEKQAAIENLTRLGAGNAELVLFVRICDMHWGMLRRASLNVLGIAESVWDMNDAARKSVLLQEAHDAEMMANDYALSDVFIESYNRMNGEVQSELERERDEREERERAKEQPILSDVTYDADFDLEMIERAPEEPSMLRDVVSDVESPKATQHKIWAWFRRLLAYIAKKRAKR